MAFSKALEEVVTARKDARVRDAAKRSPLGRATAAKARKQVFFEIELTIDADAALHRRRDEHGAPVSTCATLAAIEALGWRLEHAGYVQGDLSPVGIYLFRNVDLPAPDQRGAALDARTVPQTVVHHIDLTETGPGRRTARHL